MHDARQRVTKQVQFSGRIVIAAFQPLRDCRLSMNVEFLAWWGAVTGTIAGGYNVWQWFVDRAKLKVQAKISIVRNDGLMVGVIEPEVVFLNISAVNNGRRPVRVKHAGCFLTQNSAPFPAGLSGGPATFKSGQIRATEDPPVELSPDGGEQIWKFIVTKGVHFLSRSKGNDQYGKAYVELTSGKTIFCEFRLLKDDQWPPIENSAAEAGFGTSKSQI